MLVLAKRRAICARVDHPDHQPGELAGRPWRWLHQADDRPLRLAVDQHMNAGLIGAPEALERGVAGERVERLTIAAGQSPAVGVEQREGRRLGIGEAARAQQAALSSGVIASSPGCVASPTTPAWCNPMKSPTSWASTVASVCCKASAWALAICSCWVTSAIVRISGRAAAAVRTVDEARAQRQRVDLPQDRPQPGQQRDHQADAAEIRDAGPGARRQRHQRQEGQAGSAGQQASADMPAPGKPRRWDASKASPPRSKPAPHHGRYGRPAS